MSDTNTQAAPNTSTYRDDLAYVSDSLRRGRTTPDVPVIYFLWATMFAVGFPMVDFAPKIVGLFWLIGGVSGGLLSWWLGARHERKYGAIDKQLGMRYGMHWLVTGVAFFGVFAPAMAGIGTLESIAINFMLVAALGYGLSAVHLDRPLAIPALIMAIGYFVLVFSSLTYVWTVSGLMISVSLLVAGVISLRNQPK